MCRILCGFLIQGAEFTGKIQISLRAVYCCEGDSAGSPAEKRLQRNHVGLILWKRLRHGLMSGDERNGFFHLTRMLTL